MTVPEAMKLADFAPQEIACKARRMWIYRRRNKLDQKNVTFATPPPQQISISINSNTGSGTLSSSSMTDSGSDPSPIKKIKITRTTAQAKQTNRTARKQKDEQNKKAFKHATIWYAREKSKKGGMLACSVVTHVNKEFKVNLSERSVQ